MRTRGLEYFDMISVPSASNTAVPRTGLESFDFSQDLRPALLWAEEDSNLQPLRDTHLKRARIPIPPPAHAFCVYITPALRDVLFTTSAKVPKRGLEPPPRKRDSVLNAARLPFRHFGVSSENYIICAKIYACSSGQFCLFCYCF